MSRSSEKRDGAKTRKTPGVPQTQDNDVASPPDEGGPGAVVDRIQRIAAELDVDNLNEEDLVALSDGALHLVDVAKAQSVRKRDIASCLAQVDDWEVQHADAVAGTEVVARAVAALRTRIDACEVDGYAVSAALDLVEGFISADANYSAIHKQLRQAAADADFELVRSLNETLESLAAERKQASAVLEEVPSKPHSPEPTPRKPPADRPKAPEHEAGEAPDSLDEDQPATDQAKPSELVPTEGETEPAEDATASTGDGPTAAEDATESPADDAAAGEDEVKDGQPDTAHEVSPRRGDGKATSRTPVDPPAADEDEEESVPSIAAAVAVSIERSRFALAYHLALSAPEALPSANAIKLAAYNYVTDERATVAAELAELAAALYHEADAADDEGPGWPSHVLFTTCASLAPALAAPGGPVAQLLTFFDPWLGDTPSLRALAKTAADVSMTGVHLSTNLLREEDSLERWKERELALRNETESWIANERQAMIKYQAATKVWRRMLDDWERRNGQCSLGRIFSLLEASIANVDAASIARISEHWRANGDKEIDRIDRENRSWKPTNKIEGSARMSLRNKVNQALALSDRWIHLLEERPDKVQPFHKKQAKILRTMVRSKADLAFAEMDSTSIRLAECAGQLLRHYASLFHGAASAKGRRRVDLGDLLNGDLLADPGIAFDESGRPANLPVDSDVLVNLATRETLDFGTAAVKRAKRGDLLGAEAAVEVAERTRQIDDVSADRSRAEIENQREHLQSTLRARINETSNRLDAAYAAGVLALDAYDLHHDRIPQGDFSETDAFGPLFVALDEIDKEIADAEAGRRDTIRGSLAKLDELASADRERIESAIGSGRFQVAVDFVERLESGQGLPALEAPADRPFDRFFPAFVEKYATLRERRGDGLVHALEVVSNRDSDEFIDASDLSEDSSRDGVDLLKAWRILRDGQTTADGLAALMKALGFARPDVRPADEKTLDEESVFVFRTVPVADRAVVSLPDFGSRAAGMYALFAVRRRTTGEAIIREVGRQDSAGRPPNVVLFFGALDADARRSLARDFQTEEHQPTIVLDESLVVFLAAWPTDRLAAFFDCVSAFTGSQPYEPDAAELPPEMFFGRAEARRAILAMSGDITHFVYGGRRLGKTALLSDITREYRERRSVEPRELVLHINLAGSGIGENRPTEELWPLFAKRLADYRVVGSRTRVAESVGKRIKQWLGGVQGRRILLLVDEADAFLGAECSPKQGYRVLEQVKRLMEETQRRFKVVFAGLHNVQRAGRDPNTPFAHLGEAIRIGPMLPDTDGDQLQHLIRGPLEALGYRFVSNDSVIRIAAETNYYPALAQQFCKELLKTLREESYTLDEVGPPYPIDPVMVDRVFNARETRDRIRNLFSWTIQLDLRYEFLTYLIARSSFDNVYGRPQAMPIGDIRDAALTEWPKGFASDPSFWTFEVLLEEMVGLGILREAANKEYAIRTRNLRSLLGTDDEIERRFSDSTNRIAPPVFDRAQFRSTLEHDTLSPFTAHQESRLLSGRSAVGLVFGTHLAGLHRVGDSLKGAATKSDELFVEEVAPSASTRSALRRPLKRRKPGVHVVLMDMRGAWDSELLGRVLTFVGKREWQDRIIRPVFLCDPKGAWEWLSESIPSHDGVELHDIWLAPCGSDFTRTWLKNKESLAYADLERPDHDVDLPWPLVVETAVRNKQLESFQEVIEATLDDDELAHHVGDIVEVSESIDVAVRLLSTFATDPMTPDLLSELSDSAETRISPEEAIEFFNWASRLGIVYRDEDGYRLDSTYAEGLWRVFGT